jgi:NADH-ubiquinone oxidoreductase chain 2
MAGIPPLIGFFSKQFVLYSALQNGYYFISIVAIIVSVISASYYLKIIQIMTSPQQPRTFGCCFAATPPKGKRSSSSSCFASEAITFGNEVTAAAASLQRLQPPKDMAQANCPSETRTSEASKQLQLNFTNYHSFIISTLTLIIIFFFIKPSIILNSTQLLSLYLFYI